MTKTKVAVISSKKYGETSQNAVRQAIDAIGGIKQVVGSGDVVVIKPNLVNTFSAESGNITHYSLFEPLIECCYDAGASKIVVGEGTGSYDTSMTFISSGIKKVVDKLRSRSIPVELVDFNRDKNPQTNQFDVVDLGDEGLTPNFAFRIPHSILTADTVISVPKLKSHSLTGISVSLKNMIGIAPSEHYGYPKKRDDSLPHGPYNSLLKNDVIWRVILDLNRIMLGRYSASAKQKKYLSIVDGVVAGTYSKSIDSGDKYWLAVWRPIPVGAIIAGLDPVAVDTIATRLMCYRPEKIPTLIHAAQECLGTMSDIEVVGDSVNDIRNFVPQARGFLGIVDLKRPNVLSKAVYSALKSNVSELIGKTKNYLQPYFKK